MLPGPRRYAASLASLDALTAFVEECGERVGLAERTKSRVLLATEEAFVNICSHAYPDGAGEAEVGCAREGDGLVLEISDRGIPFDILSLPPPDTTADIMERPVGGLGIHFIRTLSDDVSYRREQGRNILCMVFRDQGHQGDQGNEGSSI